MLLCFFVKVDYTFVQTLDVISRRNRNFFLSTMWKEYFMYLHKNIQLVSLTLVI